MSEEQGSVGLVETVITKIELGSDGFKLEKGGVLSELEIAYETYGTLSRYCDNVIFICHALTGDAHVAGTHAGADDETGWWDEMVGPGKGINTDYYFVVCANILGGCKGTTGPSSINPDTGKPYGSSFPEITVGDIVRSQKLLLEQLGIDRLAGALGGSFGGMQVLEWSVQFPEAVDRCILVATSTSLSTQALAFDVVARDAITSDPAWHGGDYYDKEGKPGWGLAHARKIGHITYLSPEIMQKKFGRERTAKNGDTSEDSWFQVESYLEYQGKKLVDRFDANSYLAITQAMDAYDLADGFESLEKSLGRAKSKFLVIALSSDWLFPPEQSCELANAMLRADKDVSFCTLDAPNGHDAFLVEIKNLTDVIRAFLPWVQTKDRITSIKPLGVELSDEAKLDEYDVVSGMIEEGAKILDLGCGNGDLLSLIGHRHDTRGLGIDIDLPNVIDVMDKGHDIFQSDIDAGLAMIPDGSYDIAVSSDTIQVVRKPRLVLHEMLRVAKAAIVTFPNFGKLSHRLHVGFSGRMPKGGSLPFEWHNTPNIHLFTLRDFQELCAQEGIRILDVKCMTDCALGAILTGLGFRNLGADRVVARISAG